MRLGSFVTITEQGLRLKPRDAGLIGLTAGSKCWSVRLPNRFPGPEEKLHTPGSPEHFLLSPFHPTSWPVLFRFEFRLANTTDALTRAAGALFAANFNILGYDFSPFGYHHSVWTVIAEATDIKQHPLIRKGRALAASFDRDTMWRFANEEYAPLLLKRHRKAVEDVRRLNERGAIKGFLHPEFIKHGSMFGGILYDDRPRAGLEPYARQNQIQAAVIHWMTDLAFFWLYGKNIEEPFSLTLHGDRSLLQTEGQIQNPLLRLAGASVRLPVQTMAVFDLRGQFARVLPSVHDAENTYTADFSYRATFAGTKTKGSQGLFHSLLRNYRGQGFVPTHVTNRIVHRTPESENNCISLVGYDASLAAGPPDSEAACSRLRSTLSAVKPDKLEFELEIFDDLIRPRKLGARVLFISLRLEWGRRKEIQPLVEEAARSLGFIPRVMEGSMGDESVTAAATQAIRGAQAFLQIVGHVGVPEDERQQWMLYELGVALGVGLPCEICFDVRKTGGETLAHWQERFKVLSDKFKHQFDGDETTEEIVGTIVEAIQALARRRS